MIPRPFYHKSGGEIYPRWGHGYGTAEGSFSRVWPARFAAYKMRSARSRNCSVVSPFSYPTHPAEKHLGILVPPYSVSTGRNLAKSAWTWLVVHV
jgi:hypothetical protein